MHGVSLNSVRAIPLILLPWMSISLFHVSMSSLTYIPSKKSMKFFFQPIYTDYTN